MVLAAVACPAEIRQNSQDFQCVETVTGINWKPIRAETIQPVWSPSRQTIGALFAKAEVTKTLSRFEALLSLGENWNGYEGAAPKRVSIDSAFLTTRTFHKIAVAQGGRWMAPNVTASPDGNIVLEWWQGIKKLTLYVSPESSEYVKSWGSDIEKNMEDGDVNTVEDYFLLWNWLAY